nr:hypothetical protein [Tanacetum cinerariifolium]
MIDVRALLWLLYNPRVVFARVVLKQFLAPVTLRCSRRSLATDGVLHLHIMEQHTSTCDLIGPRFTLSHGPPFLTFHQATCTTSWEWTTQIRLSGDVSVGNLEEGDMSGSRAGELETAVADYLIPLDLHPRLPPLGMMTDKLPSRYIRLYVEQLEHGDRRAIPDAMPWRHGDTDLHDDFPSNFNPDDVERLFEFLVPLRLPPRHLLYVCGLTTACRHPRLSYSIKDQDKHVINMGTFLKLPTWNWDYQKKERQSLARAEAKRAGVEHAGGSRKKRKVQKQNEPTQFGSEETFSASTIRQAYPEAVKKPATIIPLEVSQRGPHVEKEVVDLSGNTRVSTPLVTANQPSPPFGHHDAGGNPDPDTQSHQSSYQGHELVDNRYVPSGNFEMIFVSVPIVPAESWLIMSLPLLRMSFWLNHDYVDLRNRRDTDLAELERLRSGLRKANQDKDEITKKFTLLDNDHSKCTSREKELLDMIRHLERDLELKTQKLMAAEEKVKILERERLALSAQLPQSEADRKKLVKEFIPIVVKRLYMSVEYRKSLAALVQLCFTAGWLGVLTLDRTEEEKIADSCDLSLSELWSVHPDAPSPECVTLGGAAESNVQQPPFTSLKNTSDIPFGTTT